MIRFLKISLAAASLCCGGASIGASVTLPPVSYFQSVASQGSATGNVWSGMAQSVTAVDEHVNFGFYVFSGGRNDLVYSLYAGDGIFTTPLAQVFATNDAHAPTLLLADFSNVTLTVGQQYTFVATPFHPPWIPGDWSLPNISFAGLSDPYSEGRFWFTGANFDQSLPTLANRDLAFSMIGVPAPVPEPGTWAMMIGGFALAGAGLRHRRRTHIAFS